MMACDRGQDKTRSGVVTAKWVQETAPTLEYNKAKSEIYLCGEGIHREHSGKSEK